MKKIFVASIRNWAPTFVKLVSNECSVDFYGLESNIKFNNNVNYFGSVPDIKRIVSYLKNTHQNYDLICLPDYNWQVSKEIQDLIKKIDTPVLCPSYEANRLERDKWFAKQLFTELKIPTPKYFEYVGIDDLESKNLDKFVFKLADDWIHSGMQTVVFNDDSWKKIIPKYFERGYTGKCYIEEYVVGKEAVLHFLCNGSDFQYMGSSRDYKKMFEGDRGQNVSSTGSYSPVSYVNEHIISTVENYVRSILKEIEYVGIMCVGIMISTDIQVLEINVRPGTPEFITMLNTIESKNLVDKFIAAASNNNIEKFISNNKSSVTVQFLHKSYNMQMKSDSLIPEISVTDLDVVYFLQEFHHYNYHSCITATNDSIEEAADCIYEQLNNINAGDYRFRKDIGYLL